jgi:prepilin-type N-terminal cleavage/methylation domain-containing protein
VGQRLFKKLKTHSEGFTIIEVLIVLAIAGLIMLIVFLAVPALQRNSRNTQIRNSAAAVLGGVNEFVSNNSGQMPTTVATAADGTVTISGGGGTSQVQINIQGGHTVTNGTAMPGGTGAITVYFNRKCNGNAFAGAVTNKAVAAGFLVETGVTGKGGSDGVPQCVQS